MLDAKRLIGKAGMPMEAPPEKKPSAVQQFKLRSLPGCMDPTNLVMICGAFA